MQLEPQQLTAADEPKKPVREGRPILLWDKAAALRSNPGKNIHLTRQDGTSTGLVLTTKGQLRRMVPKLSKAEKKAWKKSRHA